MVLNNKQTYWRLILGRFLCALGLLFTFYFVGYTQKVPAPLLWKEGKFVYQADSLGNRIPDFSHAGYEGGDKSIPDALVKIVVPVKGGDATARIQAAIDYVSQLPLDKEGLRGAVLLQAGQYALSGSLILHTSGVVLRGAGFMENGTVLVGEGQTRETLIRIVGEQDGKSEEQRKVQDDYVPVNANILHLDNTNGLKVGDGVMITRPSTEEWINALKAEEFGGGMSFLGWKPGFWNSTWDRRIVRIDGNQIELDVPITTALDQQYGGA